MLENYPRRLAQLVEVTGPSTNQERHQLPLTRKSEGATEDHQNHIMQDGAALADRAVPSASGSVVRVATAAISGVLELVLGLVLIHLGEKKILRTPWRSDTGFSDCYQPAGETAHGQMVRPVQHALLYS